MKRLEIVSCPYCDVTFETEIDALRVRGIQRRVTHSECDKTFKVVLQVGEYTGIQYWFSYKEDEK